ncbi:MAG TPA: preprotein translocase subunit SecA, partial [Reyranella sp.]
GFDYLRDNMKYRQDAMVQRPFNFAIVDEVDSILIDEARTPLIISGPAEDSSELYRRVDTVIPRLTAAAYEKDEKNRTVVFTEAGVEEVEEVLRTDGLLPEGISLYAPTQVTLLHHVTQALRAHKLFSLDVDYMVRAGQVVIIDEFTGRAMSGRRYSEGLHQALEAKEKVEIQRENQTLASITFQNLFRMYPKLSGMTGTAMTEAAEFGEIYRLEVVEMPTNVAVARKDADDEIYRTLTDKTRAIVKLIKECQDRNQPMLVGTVSIEKSEALSEELKKAGIKHSVLNARFHEQEAQIVAQAGRPGTITIATNMAGRGTDIQLGGNVEMLVRQSEPEITAKFADEAERKAELDRVEAEIRAGVERDREIVRKAGGLFVVGTERHESRRIDNQLRGRSGRQGDPGASRFFLSLEDDLMRIFGNNKVLDWVQKKGMADDEALTHRWLNKALETAQGKVEARNFEIRKNLLRFDDVMNSQRTEIYKERIELMGTEDVSDVVSGMRRDVIDGMVSRAIPEGQYAEQWKTAELKDDVRRVFGLDLPVDEWAKEEGIAEEGIKQRLNDAADRLFAQKVATYSPEVWRQVEKSILMQLFDQAWKDHLLHLDHLRQGIGLRAYGQKDPLNEYKREAFNLFSDLLTGLREQTVNVLANLQLRMEPPPEMEGVPPVPPTTPISGPAMGQMREIHEDPAMALAQSDDPAFDPADPSGGGVATLQRPRTNPKADPNDPSTWGKISRNAACPCGSGKKFKHCHGRV